MTNKNIPFKYFVSGYFVTVNVNVSDGVFNGASGILKDVTVCNIIFLFYFLYLLSHKKISI